MKIFVSNALNETEREHLLAEGLDDVFFLHNEFDEKDEPHEEFLESNICFGNVPSSWLPVNPNLEWIQLISVGFGEYLDLNWEKLSLQIRMTNLAGFFAEPVAQSMLAGLLTIYRGIDQLTLLKESVKWGNPIYEGRGRVIYLSATEEYVTLGFFSGANLSDVSGRMEPSGRRMRRFRVRALEDIDEVQIRAWIKEVLVIDSLGG